MVRIIPMSSIPTSSGASRRAKAGAWQSGADGHAMRAVPVDEVDQETVLAKRRAAAKAEAQCTGKKGKPPVKPAVYTPPPAAVRLFGH